MKIRMLHFLTALALGVPAYAEHQVVYVQSNNVEEGKNSILAYHLGEDGSLRPLPASPFPTGGTGIDNDTNGKLGPNDNDTPLALSPDGRRLFAVNGNSDTIAVMDVLPDGSLQHVAGSPFASMGVHPVSLAVSGDSLLVAHRNEDPARRAELQGAAQASYVSFRVEADGRLTHCSTHTLEEGLPTQVLAARGAPGIVFGNDFQVDVDFDGDGEVSRLFGKEPRVAGGIHAFRLGERGGLEHAGFTTLPETVEPAPDVPTVPLGLWDHPTRKLLYVGLVTRNELGVFRYDAAGRTEFVTSVPNSGQDICWLKTNAAGTRLYAVNNLPREDRGDRASTVTVFDISGERAEEPVEMQRIQLPLPLGSFVNNRAAMQPNSTAFQLGLDADERFLFVVNQRIDQTEANKSRLGNVLHVLEVQVDGTLSNFDSRDLGQDGVTFRSRPQGVVCARVRG